MQGVWKRRRDVRICEERNMEDVEQGKYERNGRRCWERRRKKRNE